MPLIIETAFDLGETVYRKLDRDQEPKQIIAIQIDGNHSVTYLVGDGCAFAMWCYASQLSKEKNTVFATTN